jgi:secretion/DNA translocation related CpaE-like protein
MTDHPLLVSSSMLLIDEVVRLASTVALEVQVAPDLSAAAPHWLGAPLVIIGSDVATHACLLGRRARVIVAHLQDDDDDASAQRDMWRFAVEVGAEHVVELPDGERWLVESLRQCAEGPPRNGAVVAVLGGSGGVGTSTLAVNLAVTASRSGMRSLLVDADPFGGGLDLVLGAEDASGARWSDLHSVSGHLPSGHLDAALPRVSDVSVLACARTDDGLPALETMTAVLESGRRSHDLVLIDCSRCTDDLLTVVVDASNAAVLVVGDHVRATAAAARRYSWLRTRANPVRIVHACSPRGISVDDVSRVLGVDVVASIPHVPSMTIRADEGDLPSLPRAYASACQAIIESVGAGPGRDRSSSKGRAA